MDSKKPVSKWEKVAIDAALIVTITFIIVWAFYFSPTSISVTSSVKVSLDHDNNAEITEIKSTSPSTNYSFAVMGDNRDGLEIFSRLLQQVDSERIIFAADLGDLVPDGSLSQYAIFYDLIKNLKTPFLVLPGNHDTINGGMQYYRDIFGAPYYAFSYGDSRFIFLDDSNQSGISDLQMKWLETELARGDKLKFVFMHVPPFDPRPDRDHTLSDKANAAAIIDLFAKYKPAIVFAAHIHGFFEEKKENVQYIITGGAGSPLAGDDEDQYFHHYVMVNVQNDIVNYEVVKLDLGAL